MSHILVADDEPSIRLVLRDALEAAGHRVDEAEDGDEAGQRLRAGSYDLAFLDIRMPGHSGLDLLESAQLRAGASTAIVIITAENTFEHAVEAMKRGAFDYLTKPFDLTEVVALAEKAAHHQKLRREVGSLRRELAQGYRSGEMLVGHGPAMLETIKTIGRVAPTDVAVLIRGESGTGKELVARAIHHHSPRRDAPFVAVNMSALPSELIEAELFGHERGAFTGAVEARTGRFRDAEGGTLLLDEIGDLPRPLQAKLLRVLQERVVRPIGARHALPIDVRILAATHHDLEARVAADEFREDLYFRLNVVPISIAPLRERLEDLPALVGHFVQRFADELGLRRRWPTEAAMRRLAAHAWPGNVRELENTLKRALVLSSGDLITDEELARVLGPVRGEAPGADWASLARRELEQMLDAPEGLPERGAYWTLVEHLERVLISQGLARSGGNQIAAARLLGINRNTLRKKLVDLGIALRDGPGTDSRT
ncbi:MAG: sigma-54-dependent transcriptional regulator [Myxococcota bacterium]